MAFVVFLGVVCLIYSFLMFLDFFFKSCMMLPYLEFLKTSGISVKFFRLIFYTKGFNRFLVKWTSKLPSIYRNSFKIGSYFVIIILFPIAMCLVIISLFSGYQNNAAQSSGTENIARLEILIPGVNLPLDQVGFYILSLLICSVIHEAGHGIAAVVNIGNFTRQSNQILKFLSVGGRPSSRFRDSAHVYNPRRLHRD